MIKHQWWTQDDKGFWHCYNCAMNIDNATKQLDLEDCPNDCILCQAAQEVFNNSSPIGDYYKEQSSTLVEEEQDEQLKDAAMLEAALALKYVQKLLDDAYLAHTANREQSKNNDDVKEEKL